MRAPAPPLVPTPAYGVHMPIWWPSTRAPPAPPAPAEPAGAPGTALPPGTPAAPAESCHGPARSASGKWRRSGGAGPGPGGTGAPRSPAHAQRVCVRVLLLCVCVCSAVVRTRVRASAVCVCACMCVHGCVSTSTPTKGAYLHGSEGACTAQPPCCGTQWEPGRLSALGALGKQARKGKARHT